MDAIELYRKIELLPEDIKFLQESAKRLPLAELDGFLEKMTCMETAEQAYLGLKEWLDVYEESRQEMDVRADAAGSRSDAGIAGSCSGEASSGSCSDADTAESRSTASGSFAGPGSALHAPRLRSYDMLFCHLESARRVYEKYRSLGISERIYIDTMKCFPRFMDECQARNGSRYFERSFWTYRQTSMRLFRIGALEYEMVREKGDGALDIHVHIPSDADLGEPSVDASLKEAEEFFRRYYPAYDGVDYVCHSWLLSPALGRLLPEGSHILAFQRRFDVSRVDEDDESYFRWLFQSTEDTPLSALPERTRLQRAAKAFLMDGGKIGAGYGRMRSE